MGDYTSNCLQWLSLSAMGKRSMDGNTEPFYVFSVMFKSFINKHISFLKSEKEKKAKQK